MKVIDTLTDFDPKLRCSCGEAWASLNPYAEKIDQLKVFKPDRDLSQEALLKYKKRVDKKIKERKD